MAAKTTLNAKNLEALGAERLSELLIEISMGSAASKRRLRLELAGNQSSAEVAHEVRKRLSSIDRSRTIINWRKIKALKSDLETQRTAITGIIARSDPVEAMELLWRFLGLAESVFARCSDGNGIVIACFHAACLDLGGIALNAAADKRLAEQAFTALQRNAHGACDPLIPALAPALGAHGLERLKALVVGWAKEPVEDRGNGNIASWGMSGSIREHESSGGERKTAVRRILEQVADAQGDVDAFIAQQGDKMRAVPAVAADIAARLLAVGRPAEALAAIDHARTTERLMPDPQWQQARVDTLETLGRQQDAQAFRWHCFERDLSVEQLKAFIRRLPDFDDMEAEEKAFAYVHGFEDMQRALVFFASWPAPSEAAKLVILRAGEIDGNFYDMLAPTATWLHENYPLAATILLRTMIEFALDHGRGGRYRHAGRQLNECALLAKQIADFGVWPDHQSYVAKLKRSHGRKHGFWTAVA